MTDPANSGEFLGCSVGEPLARPEAQVFHLPVHTGDGYSWGGDVILAVGEVAVNFGCQREGEKVAREIARLWNARAALTHTGGENDA